MRIYKEEIFGPVLSVVREKILMKHKLVNDHEYGNGVRFILERDVGEHLQVKLKWNGWYKYSYPCTCGFS
ncbi:MAG: hypothetical protein CM1200mP5_6440 [Candidatus Pelagibacterales bacterium]|nr:MAG: hypothetical protein CM1200mP5_6440 [Pelagibacterales bacterium]